MVAPEAECIPISAHISMLSSGLQVSAVFHACKRIWTCESSARQHRSRKLDLSSIVYIERLGKLDAAYCNLSHACLMHDPTIYHRHHRTKLLDLRIRHREVVPVQHCEVGQFARLNRTDLVLHAQEPTVFAGEQL
jgi:hypothetical protein